MNKTKASPWGRIENRDVHLLTISDGESCTAKLSDFGARLVELWLPDRAGQPADVVLGHDRPEDYATPASRYIGATCGRYANRIAGARFTLDGEDFALDPNEGAKQLHGGTMGFDALVWQISHASDRKVTFSLTSPDGDMGYPSELKAEVTYAFTAPRQMEITFQAKVHGRPTVVNLVNHAYFNLAGQGTGPIDQHVLRLAADHYLSVDAVQIPQGAPTPVDGTPFDFRTARRFDEKVPPSGFDHNFCLSPQTKPQIMALDPASGRGFHLWTDQPGVQVYTAGHFPQGYPGKSGATIGPRAGFAMETQRWPNSPNRPDFPSATLRPGETYSHRMIFTFFAN